MSSMTSREILDRTDLAALLTSLSGPPTGNGPQARWACISADHRDEHPSVSMFVDRNGIERWRCWSDGHAGTAIDAVMIGHHLDIADAMRWLQQHCANLPNPPPRTPTTNTTLRRPLSAALRRWVNECEHRLWRPEGDAALDWLRARGLGDDVLRANRIGFDPGAHVEPRAPGLPRWRGITVCSFDRDGELAYTQVRNLDGQAPSKYTNPRPLHGTLPTVTFPRSAPSDGPVVVSEGILDGLIVAQAGYRSAALISATSITAGPTSPAADAIRRHANGNTIVLALDGDNAGRAATKRLRTQLTGSSVRVLRIPDHEDLTSLHARRKDHPCPPRQTTANTSPASLLR